MPDPKPPSVSPVPVVQFVCLACEKGWATQSIWRSAPWIAQGFIEVAYICRRELPPNFANMTGRQRQIAVATIWEKIDDRRGRCGVNKFLPTVRQPLAPRHSFARVFLGRAGQAIRAIRAKLSRPAPALVPITPERSPAELAPMQQQHELP